MFGRYNKGSEAPAPPSLQKGAGTAAPARGTLKLEPKKSGADASKPIKLDMPVLTAEEQAEIDRIMRD